MPTYARLEGLDETVRALRALPAQFASKNGGPMRRALFAAAKPMRDNAQARAPIATGNLSAQVFIYRDRNPRASTGANERFLIGVRTKRRTVARGRMNRALGRVSQNFGVRGDAYYWKFVEFGTAKMRARPFLRPAFESHKHAAVTIFSRVMRTGVEAAVKRARAAR